MSFIARCPDCRTAFQISPAQLRAAEGLVRCGACLAVFAAPAHRLGASAEPVQADLGFTGPLAPPAVEDFVDLRTPLAPDSESDGARTALDRLDSPLEFDAAAPRPAWRSAGVFLLNAFLLLALAGQLAWLNRAQLADSPRLRPLLSWTCARLPCGQLQLYDVAAFRAERLAVSPHPEQAGALRVDLQFRNGAAWAQPFPLLELRFLDLGNRLLASRRFQPGEYLPEELRALREMPPQRPLQLHLDILDPGPVAVNYSLSFHAP